MAFYPAFCVAPEYLYNRALPIFPVFDRYTTYALPAPEANDVQTSSQPAAPPGPALPIRRAARSRKRRRPPAPELPLQPGMFIENVGQWDDGARFQVRGGDGTMWLAEDAIWLTVVERPADDSCAFAG